MPLPELPDPSSGWWQALVAAISGGVLTKFLDRHFGAKDRVTDRLADMENRLRDELKKEKDELRAEIQVLRKDLDDWKTRYFELLRKYGESEVALQAMRIALKEAEDEREELAKRSFELGGNGK